MKDNVILCKSMDFAVRVVNLYKYLSDEKKEYIMSKQLLRCGTSVGANAHEAVNGQSAKDFISKMHISLKEVGETEYWLTLLTRTNYLDAEQSQSIIYDCIELKRILTAIIKTTKAKID